MILLRRLIPFVASLLCAAGFVVLWRFPSYWFTWIVSAMFLLFCLWGWLLRWRITSFDFWMTGLPLMMLFGSGFGVFLFLERSVTLVLWACFIILLLNLYLETVFTFHYQPQQYSQFSFPTIAVVVLTVSGFALAACSFAFILIGLIPRWGVLPFLVPYAIFMTMHMLWTTKHLSRQALLPSIIAGLLVGEIVWAEVLWPTTYFVNAILVATALYCIPSLIHLQFRGALTRPLLVRYIGVTALITIAVLSTAQWT